MSYIAEQKALEIVKQYDYPWDTGSIFKGYIIGYDQAMKDFLEKAEEYLRKEFVDMWLRYFRGSSVDEEIEMFKNYMQDESEN